MKLLGLVIMTQKEFDRRINETSRWSQKLGRFVGEFHALNDVLRLSIEAVDLREFVSLLIDRIERPLAKKEG